jgi:gliding motility-associated-like protein
VLLKKTIRPFILVAAIVAAGLLPVRSFSQNILPPGQPEQDACNALTLCGGKFSTPYSYQGPGQRQDLDATPCGGANPETNSMWLKVTIATAGKLAFRIVPVDSLDDYDFAVVDASHSLCDGLTSKNVVRCNFNVDLPGSNPQGIVGLNDTATNPYVQGGAWGYPYAQDIDVTAGQTFLIMINNYGHDQNQSPSKGFTIDFSASTATFVSNTPPALQEIVRKCSDSSVTIQLSKPVLCSSIAVDGSDFVITPIIPIAGATGVNCVGSSGYTSQVVVNFAGHFSIGNYMISGKVGSDGNTLLDLCGNAMLLPASRPFAIPPPIKDRFLPPDTTKCDYSDIVIGAKTTFQTYLWNGGQTTRTITIPDSGPYTLQVTDTNGCTAVDSITITDSACPQYVYVPNAFTPNSDGRNDLFRPVFAGAASGFRFSVYDRWGRQVFQSVDPYSGWDGTTGGKRQPAGVYVWVCVYKLYHQPERIQRGTVMLIR